MQKQGSKLILILMFVLLISSVSAQTYTQTHSNVGGWTKNSPNEVKGWGYKFEVLSSLEDNFNLHNITFASEDSATALSPQVCLFNSSNKERIKCVGTGSKGSYAITLTFNVTLVAGNEYIFIQHNNGSEHQIYYEAASCCVNPENSTESDNIIQFNLGQYVTNVAPFSDWQDYTSTSWTSIISMVVSNLSDAPAPPPPATVASISCSQNLTSDTNHTENPYYFALDCIGNVAETGDLFNVSLYLNNTLNATTEVALNASIFILNLTYGNEGVAYDVNVTVGQGESNANSTLQATNIFLDSVLPLTVQGGGANNSLYYINFHTIINTSTSCSDTNLFNCNQTIYKLNDTDATRLTVINSTEIDSLTSTSYKINVTTFVNGLDIGRYEIFSEASDSHTGKAINPSDYDFYYNLDGSMMINNDLSIWGDELKETFAYFGGDRYKMRFTFEDDKLEHTFYIESSNELKYISHSGYNGHFVWLGKYKRWVDFEGENIKNVEVTQLLPNRYKIDVEHYTITDEIEMDSVGDLNIVSQSTYFNVTQGFTFFANDSIAETGLSNFTIYIQNSTSIIASGTTTNGNLTFNITSGNYLTNITHTSYVANFTNITYSYGGTFTWQLLAANSLYLFVYDEQTNTLINDRNFTIDVINYANVSTTYTTDTGSIFQSGFAAGNYEINYKADNYTARSYYTTILGSDTQSIDLYALLNTDTDHQYKNFQVIDESATILTNSTVSMQRYFVSENAWKTVEMSKTNDEGQGFFFAELFDAPYRFQIEYLGTVRRITTQTKLDTRDLFLSITLIETGLTTHFQVGKITTSLAYNNDTRIWTYNYATPSGTAVSEGRFFVEERTPIATNTVCNSTIASDTAGLTCNLTAYTGNDYSYYGYGYVLTTNDDIEHLLETGSLNFEEKHLTLGLTGLYLGMVLIGTMAFIGLYNPVISIAFALFGFIISQAIGLVYLQPVWLIGIILVGIIYIVTIKT